MPTLHILVVGHTDSDDQERFELSQDLRTTLDQADGLVVDTAAADAPDRAKGVGLDVAGLVISATGGISGVLAVIDAWRHRREAGRLVLRSAQGHELILEDVTPEERRQAIAAFAGLLEAEEA